jgi:ketosteroid isomerase-like protein
MSTTSQAEHNEQTVRSLYDALADHDFATYMSLMSDDIVYHAAGNCPVSGVHRGKEALMATARKTKELGLTQKITLKQLMANDAFVVALDTWSAERAGKQIVMDNFMVYRVEAGKVTEIRELIGDEIAHDAFWE